MGISAKQFEKLSERLTARKEESAPNPTQPSAPRIDSPVRIIGIDPSLRGTGFGVIRAHGQQMEYVDGGTIVCPRKWAHSKCLLAISETLFDVIQTHSPEVCVIEGLFFAKNSKTALIMGQARGAAIVAASRGGLPIYEIAARKVKQAIVGFGGAQKVAVGKMVERMLGLKETPSPDEGDALALAMTFTLETRSPIAKPIERI